MFCRTEIERPLGTRPYVKTLSLDKTSTSGDVENDKNVKNVWRYTRNGFSARKLPNTTNTVLPGPASPQTLQIHCFQRPQAPRHYKSADLTLVRVWCLEHSLRRRSKTFSPRGLLGPRPNISADLTLVSARCLEHSLGGGRRPSPPEDFSGLVQTYDFSSSFTALFRKVTFLC